MSRPSGSQPTPCSHACRRHPRTRACRPCCTRRTACTSSSTCTSATRIRRRRRSSCGACPDRSSCQPSACAKVSGTGGDAGEARASASAAWCPFSAGDGAYAGHWKGRRPVSYEINSRFRRFSCGTGQITGLIVYHIARYPTMLRAARPSRDPNISLIWT